MADMSELEDILGELMREREERDAAQKALETARWRRLMDAGLNDSQIAMVGEVMTEILAEHLAAQQKAYERQLERVVCMLGGVRKAS